MSENNVSKHWMALVVFLVLLAIEIILWIDTPYPLAGHMARIKQVIGIYEKQSKRSHEHSVHIAFTCCGGRIDESLVLVKSAVLLTNTTLVFHIFTEWTLRDEFTSTFKTIKRETGVQFYYKLYDLVFPDTPSVNSKKWRSLFSPCSSERLFYHTLMKDVDAVLYVDTDTLFLTPPEKVWSLFGSFNSSHLVGMAPEMLGNFSTNSWYELFTDTPHYGSKGVNSGVMLMNLTRIRAQPWEHDIAENLVKYKDRVRLGDQDLLNIYFHFNPELVFLCPCEINYRSDFCGGEVLMCDQPAKVVHGNRQVWHNAGQPAFNAIYKAFEELVDPKKVLPMIVEINIDSSNETYCGQRSQLFTAELYRHLT